jgi:hypothetical protein
VLLLSLKMISATMRAAQEKNAPGINSTLVKISRILCKPVCSVCTCWLLSCHATSQHSSTEWLMSLANAQGMRTPGLEPGSQAREACIILLHYNAFAPLEVGQ